MDISLSPEFVRQLDSEIIRLNGLKEALDIRIGGVTGINI
jgi:hypothetical protein